MMRLQKIDFTDLQEDVMAKWDNEATPYFETENVGFTAPDPEKIVTTIKPWYKEILDNMYLCLAELGFTSISQYILSKNQE